MADPVIVPVQGVKSPWQSKTILVNFAVMFVGALAIMVPSMVPVKAWIDANGVTIATALGVIGMILRVVSKDKIVLGD